MRAMNVANEKRIAVNFRKVVVAKPEILAACKNCHHFGYDHDDRQSFKCEVTFRKVNLRCIRHTFPVINSTVCDDHKFRHANRRDV
jgi:hypothetical protein